MARLCSVCRKPYYRRNLLVAWHYSAGRWVRRISRAHPECSRIGAFVNLIREFPRLVRKSA